MRQNSLLTNEYRLLAAPLAPIDLAEVVLVAEKLPAVTENSTDDPAEKPRSRNRLCGFGADCAEGRHVVSPPDL